ncbi:two-component response regulator ORR25-like [Oryza brachyantha]|uniref:Two-component response regulator n=1 Tax=Oryza brachyantha TaxID=4533 RepID=J3MGA0_ORYBR|nr:two-component response regulator ORR25-like [Oryza brachyantha]
MAETHGTEAAGKFPEGMRVLAVDDNPVCLMLLETLLRRCKYHATTTRDAETALRMLRERTEDFDLVISDVHMLEMDGFRLLELIGLEMDLPVIMQSANGELETMMKGVTHGACDYLVKPVQLKDIKNIWQHVVRKRKPDLRSHNRGDNDSADQKVQSGNAEGGRVGATRTRRKYSRKKRSDGDNYDGNKENMEFSTQKRTRVVWTADLHRDFVEAVNQLGVDNAVPKKILQIMKVNYMTRENIASHLQKYRLYLKRISDYTGMSPDQFPARWRYMNELQCLKNYHEHGRYHLSPAIASSNSSNPFARMNSASAMGTHGLLPTQSVQLRNSKSSLGMRTVGHGGSPLSHAVSEPLRYSSNSRLPHARNCFPSGPSGSSLANISNGSVLDTNYSSNSYADMFCKKLWETNCGFLAHANQFSVQSNCGFSALANQCPEQSNGEFLAPASRFPVQLNGGVLVPANQCPVQSNGGFLAPANQLPVQSNCRFLAPADQFPVQYPDLNNHPLVQMNPPSTNLLSTVGNTHHFPDLGNCSKSWQTTAPSMFHGLYHKDGTSLGPSQTSIPNINQLSNFATSSGQVLMFGNELHGPMSTIMSDSTSVTDFNEQMGPFNIGNNTSSTEMLHRSFTLGSNSSISPTIPSDSSISSTFPGLQVDSFAMPTQMLNGGDTNGIFPVLSDTIDQQDIFDQLDDNNGFLTRTNGPEGTGTLDDIVAGLFNHDFAKGDGAVVDEGQEFVP